MSRAGSWAPIAWRGFAGAAVPAPATPRPTLRLVPRHSKDKGGDARIARRGPWVFRNEAENVAELVGSGATAALVNVASSDGRELGSAACTLRKGVNILARMLSDNIFTPIDRELFVQRIRRASDHRALFLPGSKHHRVLNAEGDQVPGVFCDQYGDALCLQFTSAAMEALFKDMIVEALQEVFVPTCVVLRSDAEDDRSLEFLARAPPAVLAGAYRGPTSLPEEHGLAFSVDLLAEGWCSGRFFEDRPLRALIARRLRGRVTAPRVLSAFGDSLGLLCAALGGEVLQCLGGPSAGPMREHFEGLAKQGGFADRLRFEAIEASSARLPDGATGFDFVTLEPPALAPTYGQVEEGMRLYAAWVAAAAKALGPSGELLVACRSRTISTVLLLRCVNLGLWSVGRRAQVLYRSAAGPSDFPTHMALPDSGGLKAVLLRLQ